MRRLLISAGALAATALALDARAQDANADTVTRHLNGIQVEVTVEATGARQLGILRSATYDSCKLRLALDADGSQTTLDFRHIAYVWGWSTQDTLELSETGVEARTFVFDVGASHYSETRRALEILAEQCGSTLGEPQLYEVVGAPAS